MPFSVTPYNAKGIPLKRPEIRVALTLYHRFTGEKLSSGTFLLIFEGSNLICKWAQRFFSSVVMFT